MTDTIKIERYTVEFDDKGATILVSSQARYRINAATASNAVDFLKHHRALIFAMENAHPEEMTAYRIAGQGN